MRHFLRHALRFGLACLLLFVALALARATLALGGAAEVRHDGLPALLGFLGVVGIFCLGFRGRRAYIFGHELTHWLVAKAFRRRTGAFRIGKNGGSVYVENPNAVITLAPYFVPLFSLIWIGLYGIYLAIAGYPSNGASFLFAVGLGATYGFHVALTVWALALGQQDLLHCGRPLSVSIIALGNVAILFLAAVVVSGRWGAGMVLFGHCLRDQWQVVERGHLAFWHGLRRMLGK